jgi:two-component system, NtrC family, nitrogen regulation sensor histidine kinase NtrY
VTLRTRIAAYLAAVHVLFGALALAALWSYPWVVIGVEIVFALSLTVGVRYARHAMQGLALGAEAARLMRDRELTARLRETGDPAVDALIAVYNRMVDSLRAERARVQEQQYFFRQVVDASPTGVVILDLDRRVADINPAGERLLETSRAALLEQPLECLGSVVAAHVVALPPGHREVITLPGPRRVRCHHGAFVDRGFRREFYLIEELTEELRRFERDAYEKLIRVMSHEVNNTVTSANSLLHSSLLYAAALPDDSRGDVQRAIGIVIARTEALSQFMRGFADVFRLPPPSPAPCVLQDVVAPLVELIRARPESAGLRFEWDAPAAPVIVPLDSAQFEQACLNILKNAGEAAGPGGRVRVAVDSAEGRPRLTVEDSGPGFSPEVLENLFTPFFSTKAAGQGIGLTLVQEILSGHGFDYRLEHDGPGPTRFTVTMPCAAAGVSAGRSAGR